MLLLQDCILYRIKFSWIWMSLMTIIDVAAPPVDDDDDGDGDGDGDDDLR